jgi:hypothetical protein
MLTLLSIAIGTLAVFGALVFVTDRVEQNKFVATLTPEQRRRLRTMRWGTWRDVKCGIARLDGTDEGRQPRVSALRPPSKPALTALRPARRNRRGNDGVP